MSYRRRPGFRPGATVCLICLVGCLTITNIPAEGQASLVARGISMMTKLVARTATSLSRVDYATLGRNAKSFVETALTGKELYDLYRHMTDVDKEHRSSHSLNAHVKTCPVCNEFFCALTEGTKHAPSVPLLYGLEPNEILIRNPTSKTLKVKLRSANGNWKSFSIPSGRSFEFNRADYISLGTKKPSGQVEKIQYRLKQQRKYNLSWCKVNQRWDIFRISS